MTEPKLFQGLRGDQPFAYADLGDTLLVDDPVLGPCKVDMTKRPGEQFLVPVEPGEKFIA